MSVSCAGKVIPSICLLDAVPFVGTFLDSIGEKLAAGTFSLKGVYEELSRVLIRATSGNAGLFLLIDDLHAADPDTLYFLNYLFRKLENVPVLAAATIHEEQLSDYPELADVMAEWAAMGYGTLTVVPLERAHVGEYVRMMSASGEQADESIVDRLFRLTGGNPFFLREALSLITQSPESRPAEDAVPPRADAILRRRLARTDEMTRHFLRAMPEGWQCLTKDSKYLRTVIVHLRNQPSVVESPAKGQLV